MTQVTRTQKTESNIELMKRLLEAGYSRNSIVARFCRRYRARKGYWVPRAEVVARVEIYARICYRDNGFTHAVRQATLAA